ncbi:MAG: hypothetical protein JWP27_109 [Flaviaesturariibacter sp.]|nr:hypothetical protein [Flaviaesturariibacter sp.]
MIKQGFLGGLCLLLVVCAAGQTTGYSIFAGAQMTDARYLVYGKKQETGSKPGGQAGFTFRIPFENRLSFTPSFYYSGKGFAVVLNDSASMPGIDVVRNDLSLHTFEIAPLFELRLGSSATYPFIAFGPTFDVAIAGTERRVLESGATVKRSMAFGSTSYGRFTAAALVRLGIQTRHGFFVFGHYSYGLGSLNNADYGPSIKHRIAGVSIGTALHRKPKKQRYNKFR